MAQVTFTPQYTRRTENKKSRDVVTNVDWNELWNLNSQQGDHSEGYLDALSKYLFGTTGFDDTQSAVFLDVLQRTASSHTHSNKALLDTYDQTNSDISSAISLKHSHSNKALLDTYNQTNADITTAVTSQKFTSVTYGTTTYSQITGILEASKIPVVTGGANGIYMYGGTSTIGGVSYHFFYALRKNNIMEDGIFNVKYVTCSAGNVWDDQITTTLGFDSDEGQYNGDLVMLRTTAGGRLRTVDSNIVASQVSDAVSKRHAHANLTELNKITSLQETALSAGQRYVPSSTAVMNYVGGQLAGYQTLLISGQNIKTINGQSIVGNGNLPIEGTSYTQGTGIGISAENVISVKTNELSYNDLLNKPTIPTISASATGSSSTEAKYLTINGTEWKLPEGGSGAVTSVNGQTGVVVLDAEDVGALPTGYHDSSKQDTIDANTLLLGGINYVTTAPTSANTIGLKFAVLSSAPATKYDGWIYIIPNS